MEKFIKQLKSLGLQLKVNGQDLLLLGKEGKLTSEDIQMIKNRPDITSFIKENKEAIISDLKKGDFKLDRKNVSSIYGLSPVQEGILFHSIYLYNSKERGNTTYHTQFDVGFSSGLDVVMFKKAWQYVINNHTILRTGFIYDKVTIPLQFVNKEVEVPLRLVDVTNDTNEEKEAKYKALKDQDRFEDFSFTEPPLMRITIVKFDEKNYKMVWTKHHVLWDGWSGQVIIQEVIRAYTNLMQGIILEAREEDKYEDFINYIKSIDAFKEKEFWKSYMEGFEEPTLLPFCKASYNRNKGKGVYKRQTIDFDIETTKKISEYSKSQHVTANTLTQAVWAILLSKYTGREDIAYGVTVSGRPAELNYDSKVGLYINTIPLRAKIDQDQTITGFLAMLQKTSVEARNFQHTALNKIQEWNDIKGDCFDSLLSFTNYPNKEGESASESLLDIDNVAVKENNNYLVTIQPSLKNKLVVDFTFNSTILDETYITMICGHFKTLIHQIINQSVTTLKEIDVHSSADKNKLLIDFNNTDTEYPTDVTLVDLIEKQIKNNPEGTALIYEGDSITYKALNEKSNKVANYLRSVGVKEDSLVGICMDRSFEMVIGLLGIIKAGGAYVPIDPLYPKERITYILEDIATAIVLVNSNSINTVTFPENVKTINLDTFEELFSTFSDTNPEIALRPSNLAYVIYTSGSTGKPKGVMNEHVGIVNRLLWAKEYYNISSKDVLIQKTTFCFDVSVWEFFLPLLTGSTLVIPKPEGHKNSEYLRTLIAKHKVTMIHFVPSMLSTFLLDIDASACASLKNVICSGEALKANQVKDFQKVLPEVTLSNLYGPTEAAIDVTSWKIPYPAKNLEIVPIGTPMANTQIYILDEHLNPQPIGVSGGLYIGGIQVARGYLNRPELNEYRFIDNPFGNGKLYRTGDNAQWHQNGTIEYLGREDNQVKIRGYRIELGGIEATLNNCPFLYQGVITTREDDFGTSDLVGYIVLKDEYSKENVITYLKEQLPSYMVPSIFVVLDKIPLTENGKVNRKALPKIGLQNEDASNYIAARTPQEEHITQIWKEILNIENIGVFDDFFECGGHSLKLTRLIIKYQKEFGVKIALRDLFANKTIASHCNLLFEEDSPNVQEERILPVSVQPNYTLSNAQYNMWLLSQSEESNISYNMPAHLVLEGGYDIVCLKKAIYAVVNRHETLRTVFKRDENSEVRQWILTPEEIDFTIQEHDFRGVEKVESVVVEYMNSDALQPFDLEKGPLLKIALLQLSDNEYVFYYNMHHIIGDGVSKSILKRDVLAYYNAFKNTTEVALPTLEIQYKDFATWQKQQLDNGAFDDHKKYWLQKLSGDKAVLDLPSQKVRPKVKTNNGQTLRTLISDTLTDALTTYCKTNNGTLFTGVLTVWNILLYRYTNQKDIIIGSPIAGRNHIDLENQIGLYFNNMVIRNQMNPEENFDQTFSKINECMFENTKHQMYPFDNLIDDLNIKGDTSRNPLYDVMLSYHNTGENDKKIQLTQQEVDQIIVQDQRGAKLDLLINFKEIGNYLYFDINYNTDLYNQSSIKVLMNDFKHLLSQLLKNRQEKISDVDFQKEIKQHLRNLNVSKFKLVKK